MAGDEPTEELGRPGEVCGGCGSALAVDQRYCLNCGRRRSDQRLDYLQYLVEDRPAEEGTTTAPTGDDQSVQPRPPRDGSPLVAVGGIAILGLMLLVGVLIGRGGDGDDAPPAVVSVPTATAGSAEVAEEGGQETASTGGESKDAAGGKKDGGGGGGGGEVEDASLEQPEQVSSDELQALENAEGDAYLEASENLPDTIQLPGEPPPKDNAKPGGGTEGVTID